MYKTITLVALALVFTTQSGLTQSSQEAPVLVKKPWIGVATSEVPKTLREYLDLKEGFGVQITHIPEGSPAAGAGLKPGDILTKFDDQLLTSPLHLAILVRAQEGGQSVKITYLRKATELTASIVLVEKDVKPLAAIRGTTSEPRQARGVGELIARYYGGSDRIPSHYRAHKKVTSNAVVKIDNEHGEVKLYTTNGQGIIEINNAAGDLIHQGPYDPSSGIEGLPKSAQDHLKLMKVEKIESLLKQVPAERK